MYISFPHNNQMMYYAKNLKHQFSNARYIQCIYMYIHTFKSNLKLKACYLTELWLLNYNNNYYCKMHISNF